MIINVSVDGSLILNKSNNYGIANASFKINILRVDVSLHIL